MSPRRTRRSTPSIASANAPNASGRRRRSASVPAPEVDVGDDCGPHAAPILPRAIRHVAGDEGRESCGRGQGCSVRFDERHSGGAGASVQRGRNPGRESRDRRDARDRARARRRAGASHGRDGARRAARLVGGGLRGSRRGLAGRARLARPERRAGGRHDLRRDGAPGRRDASSPSSATACRRSSSGRRTRPSIWRTRRSSRRRPSSAASASSSATSRSASLA